MKLSEIFGWKKKKAIPFKHVPEQCAYCTAAWNDSLTSCDREIDREALAKELSTNGMITHASLRKADKIISTMPTWLKKVD